MNWYKRIYSAYERKFTVRELLPRFKAYGIIFTRSASGSGHTLMNENNGQHTNFHYHKLGEIVPPGKLQNMLRGLGIDYNEFIKYKKPIERPIEQPIEQSTEESWKKDKWYQNYLKSIKTDKMDLKNELV